VLHADGNAVVRRRLHVDCLRPAPVPDDVDRSDVVQRRVGAVGRAPGGTGDSAGRQRHDLRRHRSRPPPSSDELLLLRVAGRTARPHVDHGYAARCPRSAGRYVCVRRDLIGQLALDNEGQDRPQMSQINR